MRVPRPRFTIALLAAAALWLMGADGDVPAFALASVLSITGAAIAAGLITTLIEVLKNVPQLGAAIQAHSAEQGLALLFSLILVILAFFDAHVWTLPYAFQAFVAWLAIAKLATGIHDEVTAAPGSFREASA